MTRFARYAARLLPALAALGLLGFVLRAADLGRALDLLDHYGWRLPLLLLPNLLASASETLGWWLSFSRLGSRPPLPRLLAVRMAGDALMLGLPSGTVVSESMQPYLLKHRCHVPLEKGIAAGVARKFFVVASHGLFLLGATLATWPLLADSSGAAIGRDGLPWVLVGASSLLIAAAVVVAATARERAADRTYRILDRIGGRWVGTWLQRNAASFKKTDTALRDFFERRPLGLLAPLGLHLLAWLVRSAETYVFLSVVGVSVAFPTAMVIETALILVRAMAVPLPAGIGVQDVGYLLCLRALHLPDPTTVAAAFLVLKRGRDIFWILVGLLILAAGRGLAGAGVRAPASAHDSAFLKLNE